MRWSASSWFASVSSSLGEKKKSWVVVRMNIWDELSEKERASFKRIAPLYSRVVIVKIVGRGKSEIQT